MRVTTLTAAFAVALTFAQTAHAREHHITGMPFTPGMAFSIKRGAILALEVIRPGAVQMISRHGASNARQRPRSHGRLVPHTMVDLADGRAPGAAGR